MSQHNGEETHIYLLANNYTIASLGVKNTNSRLETGNGMKFS